MEKTIYAVKSLVKRAFCSVRAETSFILDALDFRLNLGLPIIAVSHFAKVYSLQNFVSYGNPA